MSDEKIKGLIDKILDEKKAIIVSKIHSAQEDIMTQLEGIKEIEDFYSYDVPEDFALAAPQEAGEEVKLLHEYTKKISMADSQLKLISLILEGINQFCSRGALFLLRDDKLVGWKGIGFSATGSNIGDDEIKKIFFSLSANTIFRYTLDTKRPYSGPPSSQPDDQLIYTRFGGPTPEKIFVLPFFVKGKAQAVIYTDMFPPQQIKEKEIEIIATVGEMSLDLLPLRQKILAKVKTREFMEDFSEGTGAETQLVQLNGGEIPKSLKSNDPERKARVIINDIMLYNKNKVEEALQSDSLVESMSDTIQQAKEEYLRKYDDLAVFEKQLIQILAKGDRDKLKGYRFEAI
jgi:hypothetical protein